MGFGILINHPNWDYVPNVLPIAFDFPSNFPEELKPYIPVVDLNSKQNLPSVVVCVVTQDLCDQELFMDYRYPLSRNLPDWYVPLI